MMVWLSTLHSSFSCESQTKIYYRILDWVDVVNSVKETTHTCLILQRSSIAFPQRNVTHVTLFCWHDIRNHFKWNPDVQWWVLLMQLMLLLSDHFTVQCTCAMIIMVYWSRCLVCCYSLTPMSLELSTWTETLEALMPFTQLMVMLLVLFLSSSPDSQKVSVEPSVRLPIMAGRLDVLMSTTLVRSFREVTRQRSYHHTHNQISAYYWHVQKWLTSRLNFNELKYMDLQYKCGYCLAWLIAS